MDLLGFSYSGLEDKYNNWDSPMAYIQVDEKFIFENSEGISISDIDVELTCGFEAGQASYSIFDCYDLITSSFNYKQIKNYSSIGSQVVISVGYSGKVREVFRGLIVRTEYVIDEAMAPHVRVTAMDIKSIMMANHYHKKLVSTTYSAAVREIMTQAAYTNLTGPTGVITMLNVTDTPDALTAGADAVESDSSIEMVGESDYEFIVRAAKKFNYEFFCISGQVLFRPARGDVTTLISLPSTTKVLNMNVAYDITGLVGKVTVRGLDVGKAQAVSATQRHTYKISTKTSAKSLISDSEYVYVDPTVTSKIDASNRCSYLFDEMSYRFGTLDMEIFGLPELIPGRFISIKDFGSVVSNTFYVKSVHHHFDLEGRFSTRIIGEAQNIQMDMSTMV